MNDTDPRDPATMRILCLAGSLRRDSWNRRLLVAAAHTAPKGLELSLFEDLAAVSMFNEDAEHAESAGVRQLRCAVAKADGLLIATPEYNQSFPGVLKNAIDWLSRGSHSVLVDKPVAIIGATTGRWGTRLAQAALRQVLTATEARVMPAPMLFVAQASESLGIDGQRRDPRLAKSLSDVLIALRNWTALHAQASAQGQAA